MNQLDSLNHQTSSVGHSSFSKIEVANVARYLQLLFDSLCWSQFENQVCEVAMSIQAVEQLVLAMQFPVADADNDPEWVRSCVQAIQNGNNNSYSRIVSHYQQTIGQQMLRFSREPVVHEELTHDVFVEAFLSLKSYRYDSPFVHWLRRIAVRVGYRHWKQLKRNHNQQGITEEQWELIAKSGASQELLAAEAAEIVHCVLAQLPPADRLVLTVVYLDGCSLKEAAFRCGWTLTGTKLRVFRARRKLTQLLNEKHYE